MTHHLGEIPPTVLYYRAQDRQVIRGTVLTTNADGWVQVAHTHEGTPGVDLIPHRAIKRVENECRTMQPTQLAHG